MNRFFSSTCFILLILLVGQSKASVRSLARLDAVNPLAPRYSSLDLTANIYFGDQYEEAVPVRSDFYLLDRSFVEILKTAEFKPEFADGQKHQLIDEDYLEAAAKALTDSDDAEAEVIAFLIKDALTGHQVAAAATNRFGRGSFKPLKTGNYYLFGIGSTEAEIFVWHLPVRVEPGGEPIELDQTDAAVIFAAEE